MNSLYHYYYYVGASGNAQGGKRENLNFRGITGSLFWASLLKGIQAQCLVSCGQWNV